MHRFPGHRVTLLAEADSTNRYARERFAELDDLHAVVAERQTAGRGRLDRRWLSPAGNLHLTLVLKNRPEKLLPFANLTQYMAVVASRCLEEYGVPPAIKWPNDILIGGRKIAGILAEGVIGPDGLAGAVLGIGVNLRMDARALAAIDQPATSLDREVGGPVDRDRFLGEILDGFASGYRSFLTGGFSSIREEFVGRASFLGRQIQVVSSDSHVVGTALDITEDGALLLETAEGRREEYTLGDMACW